MSKKYGRPGAALVALEHSTFNHNGPSSTSPTRSMDFGASAFFGGTAMDTSQHESENEDELELSLDDIKRRYLKKNPSDDQTQRVGDGVERTQLVLENSLIDSDREDDTQARTGNVDKTQLIDRTQLMNDDKTQAVPFNDSSRLDSSVDFSKDTVDLLPNSIVHQTQSQEDNPDNDVSSSFPLIRSDAEKGVLDQEEEDDDDDIIVHKKRSYSVLTDFLEDESEVSDGESSEISTKKMKKDKSIQPIKRLSKKAIEETEMESARTGRGLELAPEVKTGKELTVEGFLDNFVSDSKVSDASPQKSSEGMTTPQTSPVSHKEQLVSPIKAETLAGRDFKNLITPRRLASFVKATNRHDDSDDDLEIIPSTKASTTSKAVKKLAEIAEINPYKTRVPISKRKSPKAGMKTKSLIDTLAFKQREQAMRYRDERMADLKARGVSVISEEEKKKEAEIVESLLEQQRRHAEEVRKREKSEKSGLGSDDDEMDLDFDAEYDDFEEHEEEEEDEEEEDDGEGEEDDAEESEEELEEDDNGIEKPQEAEDGALEVSASQSFTANVSKNRPTEDLYESDNAEPEFIESSQNIAEENDAETQLSQYPDPTQSPIGSPNREHGSASPARQQHDQQQQASAVVEEGEEEVDDEENDDEEEDGERIKVRGRRRILPAKVRNEKPKYDKKKSAARGAVDDEAAESEDEWAGLGGAENKSDDEDDNENYNLENLVDDNTGEKALEVQNQELWAERERERDEALVTKLVDDVTNGGWRRRKAATGGFLDLSDDDEVDLEKERQRREERKAQRLLDDANLSNIAQNPKAQAFIESIVDKSTTISSTDEQENRMPSAQDIRESLSFLDASHEVNIEEEQVSTVTTGDMSIQRAVHIKTVDRMTERRSFVTRARNEDSGFSRRRSIAVVEASYKVDSSRKEVKVVQSLTNSNFGSGKKSSVVVKRQLHAPSIIRKGNVLPKSASLGSNLFKTGGWE